MENIRDTKVDEFINLERENKYFDSEIAYKLGVSIPSIRKWRKDLVSKGLLVSKGGGRKYENVEKEKALFLELITKNLYTDKQVCVLLKIKGSTLQKIKRELRQSGIEIPAFKGCPTKAQREELENITNIGIIK